LVGSSGAGKSTIIQLLLRNYPLNKGNILIDDKDFTAYDIQDLRANTAIVPQEVTIIWWHYKR
jgi:ATP-binding cassette subfamily B protein